MYIIASFEHSTYLELAITAVQQEGVIKQKILAVPLDKREEKRSLFDTMHHSDGISLIDTPIASATGFAVLGSSYGFTLTWGPIIWGLIGATVGFASGLVINILIQKRRNSPSLKRKRNTEVFIMIQCNENQVDMVKKILWEHFALGVAVIVS